MRPKHYHEIEELLKKGHESEARNLCERLCKEAPQDVDAWQQLGMLHIQAGDYASARECLQRVIELSPEDTAARYNLAKILSLQGHLQEAVAQYEQVVRAEPGFAAAWNNLGNLLFNLGRLREAEPVIRRALELAPKPGLYATLGWVLTDLQRHAEAREYLQQALQFDPHNAEVHFSLGVVSKAQGKAMEAMAHFRQAIDRNPDMARAYANMGMVLEDLGRVAEAVGYFEKFLELQPDEPGRYSNLSNLLFLQSYNVLLPPREMLEAHQAWDRIHGGAEKAATFTHARNGSPDKRLRIGYVSPDFRNHPVSYFIEPILAAHDHERVEVYCYAEVALPDAVTQRLQGHAHVWRSTVGMGDEAVARMIHEDGIDILVDLAGHTAGNRLQAFTYRPAPVQATYLGYFTTTGLSTMDYWISDEVLHPQDTVELASETIYRLPRCCVGYVAPEDSPEVMARPAGEDGMILGSFNELTKLTPAAIRLWSLVMTALPDARLLLKARRLDNASVQEDLAQRFAAHGIPRSRLIFYPRTASFRQHMATYGEMDIALDPLPRTGGTTTMEALWMGVPVVTLAGERFIERLSASVLAAIGLEELVAESEADYIDKVCALAADHERRQALRSSLRQRMSESSLCNARSLARAMEDAYADMWHRYITG